MRNAIQVQTTVLPGPRVEITNPNLPVGEQVEVVIVLPERPRSGIGVLDFLDALPQGPRSAATWEQIEQNLQAERDSWDR
jgi:hypothetical protein